MPNRPRPVVLIVEDDPALGLMLTWELSEQGVEPILAAGCAEALAVSRGRRLDLALVDADLRDGDGVVLAKALARAHPRARVAIHSGRHAIAAGVDLVLTKPVPVARLVQLLREGVNESEGVDPQDPSVD